MPILDVEMVGGAPSEGLAARLAEAAGEALGARPGGTWVRLRVLPSERYAESGGGPGEGVRPVFVRVLRADVPGAADLAEEVRRLTAAVAGPCERPVEHVHVLYEAPAVGRLAFGGYLLAARGNRA